MTPRRDRRRGVNDAIFADEIGVEYGVIGDYRLRSAYQPIFAPRTGTLELVAVEALIEPYLAGERVLTATFFDGLPSDDRLYAETMCRMLHLRNFRNLGVGDVELFVNFNPQVNNHVGRALAEIRLMAKELGAIGIEAKRLVCEITEQRAPDDAVLKKLVSEIRRNGIGVAIDDFGAGHSTERRIDLIKPDLVKLDGSWFQQLCNFAEAEQLFRLLVAALHARGVRVLAEGIETPDQLRIALDGGVDLLQGFHLGRPALAGAFFDEGPLAIDALVGRPAKVLPFQKIHHWR